MFWDIDFILKKYINNEQNFKKCLLKTKPFFETFIHEYYVDAVKFIGDLVLSKSTNGVILLWKPLFNNEKDHHFIIKKLLYSSSEIWFVKFHLNLIENLLFIGDNGTLNIYNIDNNNHYDIILPDISLEIEPIESYIIIRSVIYDNKRNILIIGKDNGKLCFAKLNKKEKEENKKK